MLAEETAPAFASLKDRVSALADRYEKAIEAVKALENQEAQDFLARRLYDMTGEILMSLLLLHDASLAPDLFGDSARVYVQMTEENVIGKAAYIEHFSLVDLPAFRAVKECVMISVRNFSSNIQLIPIHFPYKRDDNYVSVLPYAHIFGLVYDLMAPLCYGMTLCILYVPPVPAYLKPALRAYKPYVFFAVPLIINKMIDDTIGEFIHSKSGAAKLADYRNNPDFCEALRTIFMNAFGGRLGLMITGGAAMPEQLERLFLEQLKVPFVTGYGMTECTPTITLGHKETYVMKECGEPVPEGIELKIDSPDPHKVAGEVLVRGHVVFTGYYKNPEATRAVFTDDGWFRTGDLGTVDGFGRVFLVGRSKSMILGTNGQNIFPEEIEVVLNQLPYVQESIVVGRGGQLTALIVPNQNQLADNNIDSDTLKSIMDGNLTTLNEKIPAYASVRRYELQFEPFSKTPKGSIKRFMYK